MVRFLVRHDDPSDPAEFDRRHRQGHVPLAKSSMVYEVEEP
jgi:hypothetical protein